MTFRSGNLDRIEESTEPHTHPEPSADTEDISRQGRRLRVLDGDVRKFGYTDSCQRCEYLKHGRDALARGVRHNEECREKVYDSLRQAGAERIKRADLEDASRTQTKVRKAQDH